jgi:hypothetical protein
MYSLWLHYVTVLLRIEFYLLLLIVLWHVFGVLGVLLLGLSCCVVGFLLWVFVVFVGSPCFVVLLVGLSCCRVGFFLWVFVVFLGSPLLCYSRRSSVRCWCGTLLMFWMFSWQGCRVPMFGLTPVGIRCFAVYAGSPHLFKAVVSRFFCGVDVWLHPG